MLTTVVDYASSLLCDGRGACFVVSPPMVALPPFSTTAISITAYSNMWGQYTDQLLCKVSGYGYTHVLIIIPYDSQNFSWNKIFI